MKVTEWIHRLLYQGKTVRVWMQANPEFPTAERDTQRTILDLTLEELDGADCLEKVAALDGVNAVEVMDAAGRGRLVYPEWP